MERPNTESSISQVDAAGVVLCGGRSRRMGVAKWQLSVGGTSMLDRVLDAISKCDPLVVSVGVETDIRAMPEDLIVVRDSVHNPGPLAALLDAVEAVSKSAGSSDFVVVVSCDIPLLRSADVSLLKQAISQGNDDAVIARASGRIHPTVACYRIEPLRSAADRLVLGNNRLDSLAMLLRCRFVDLPDVSVWNVNSRFDLDRAEEFLADRS